MYIWTELKLLTYLDLFLQFCGVFLFTMHFNFFFSLHAFYWIVPVLFISLYLPLLIYSLYISILMVIILLFLTGTLESLKLIY